MEMELCSLKRATCKTISPLDVQHVQHDKAAQKPNYPLSSGVRPLLFVVSCHSVERGSWITAPKDREEGEIHICKHERAVSPT